MDFKRTAAPGGQSVNCRKCYHMQLPQLIQSNVEAGFEGKHGQSLLKAGGVVPDSPLGGTAGKQNWA